MALFREGLQKCVGLRSGNQLIVVALKTSSEKIVYSISEVAVYDMYTSCRMNLFLRCILTHVAVPPLVFGLKNSNKKIIITSTIMSPFLKAGSILTYLFDLAVIEFWNLSFALYFSLLLDMYV